MKTIAEFLTYISLIGVIVVGNTKFTSLMEENFLLLHHIALPNGNIVYYFHAYNFWYSIVSVICHSTKCPPILLFKKIGTISLGTNTIRGYYIRPSSISCDFSESIRREKSIILKYKRSWFGCRINMPLHVTDRFNMLLHLYYFCKFHHIYWKG